MKAPKTNTDDLALGKRSYYRFPLSMLEADPENVRKDFGDVEALAQDIAANGIRVPLLVRRKGVKANVFVVTDGHRRLAAVKMAQALFGTDLKDGLPCLIEDKGTKDEDRLLSMLSAGTHGKPLTDIEEGVAYRKAVEGFGMDIATVARRTGRSVAYVKGCMEKAANPEAAHLKPTAAAKLSGLSKSAAARVLASGARTGRQVEDAVRARARLAGRRAIMRELERRPAKEPENDYQRGVLAGLEFALGKQTELAWGEA